MTLYYEDDPADETTVPQLPPLLRAVEVPAGQDVLAKDVAVAANTEVGTVFYAERVDRMQIAVRLETDVALSHHPQCADPERYLLARSGSATGLPILLPGYHHLVIAQFYSSSNSFAGWCAGYYSLSVLP